MSKFKKTTQRHFHFGRIVPQGNCIKMSEPTKVLFQTDCTGESSKGLKLHALIPTSTGSIGKYNKLIF